MIAKIAGRIGTPAFLGLALVLFLLPFLSVACDTPGGYGRMTPGGTTTYSGLDLAVGGSPSVDAEHLRPVVERQPDELGWQPLVAAALVGLAVALVLSLARARLGTTIAAVALAAVVALVVGVLLARSSLVERVAVQATEPFPTGKSASDYVAVGLGFWSSAVAGLLGAGCALVGVRAARAPSRRVDRADEAGHPSERRRRSAGTG